MSPEQPSRQKGIEPEQIPDLPEIALELDDKVSRP